MDSTVSILATAGVIVSYFLYHVMSKRFDPFAPVWMFLVGYLQIYVIQAYKYHDWGVNLRGDDIVSEANFRAFWALLWFLGVYHLGLGRVIARVLPTPPSGWSIGYTKAICPLLVVWGLLSAGFTLGGGAPAEGQQSAEDALMRAFPFFMLVASSMLVVAGRSTSPANRMLTTAGILTAICYSLIWMYNAKRSHSLMGVVVLVGSLYISRVRRPSWPVLCATAVAGVLAVGIAIGWRATSKTESGVGRFVEFVTNFDPEILLMSMNLVDDAADVEGMSYESKEYGGYLLMVDVVPSRSDYDYGLSYIRTFSTFIPRIIWPTKPLYGRDRWIAAWIAGSELKRDEDFAGPAIGILGATQLNGGGWGTMIVLGVLATLLRVGYEFFRMHETIPWAQFAWSIFFFNTWFMVVGDDPMTWFYYNWGFTGFPTLVLSWLVLRIVGRPEHRAATMAWS